MHASHHQQSKLTRDRILQAAMRHFSECGYAAASIQRIARTAKVTKPTIYYHFGSKVGLFRVLLDEADSAFEELVVYSAARALGLSEQLVEVCAALLEFASTHAQVAQLALGSSVRASGDSPPQAHCRQRILNRLGVIEKLMRKGLLDGTLRSPLKADMLAACFLGLLHYQFKLHLARSESRPMRRVARELVAVFLHGAAVSDNSQADPPKGVCASNSSSRPNRNRMGRR